MSITEFIQQAHVATLDYIEEDLMNQLIRIDRINKAKDALADLKEETNALV